MNLRFTDKFSTLICIFRRKLEDLDILIMIFTFQKMQSDEGIENSVGYDAKMMHYDDAIYDDDDNDDYYHSEG